MPANHRKSFWGPRALAVISCALALLAAQPAMAASQQSLSKPVLLKEAGSFAASQRFEISATQAIETKVARTRQQSFLASARHLHMLATVEIFHRLLLAELRAGERQVLPVFLFQPVCIEVLAPAACLPIRHHVTALPPHQVAQAYAIGHCLLAPPIA